MSVPLPAPITAFFQAHNSGQTDSFSRLFSADAEVADESHEYRGDAIRAWMDDAIAKYSPLQAEVTSWELNGSEYVVTAQVSGTFPGSPVQLRYAFNLRNDQIATLKIYP